MTPSDWKQIARACLSGGDYLLWKSEFTEQCGHIAELNQRQGINTTYEMLIGEGAYQNMNAQLNYLPVHMLKSLMLLSRLGKSSLVLVLRLRTFPKFVRGQVNPIKTS